MLLCSFVLLALAGCGGADNSQPTTAPTQPALAPTGVPTPTIFISGSGGGRRAPTLAPTVAATAVSTETPLPTDTATVLPSATALPAATSTRSNASPTRPNASPTRPNASPTSQLAAAVYVTGLSVDPLAPKSKPAEFRFHVKFLNTVGENVNYPRWRVLILPKDQKGQSKAVGDPQGASKTIVNGASEQTTGVWSIKVAFGCESYVAQPVWENEDGKQTRLVMPNGQSAALEFQVCP